jgi:hypothetical protein
LPYKDPEKRKEYQREYQRLLRAGEPTRAVIKPMSKPLNPQEVRTAQGLLGVLASLIGEVLTNKEGDIFMRARTAGYLISIGLKAVEVADLESRLTNLENRVWGDKK